MSKYIELKPQIQLVSRQNPNMGSDKVAEIVCQTHPDVSPSALGRYIRANSLLHSTSSIEQTPSRVILFDTEIAPMVGTFWSLYQDRINPDDVLQHQYMFCWSAKDLLTDEIYSMSCTEEECKDQNDHRIVKGLWDVFDTADVLIAHNLNRYDAPMANTRFLKHRMPVPSHYQVIDTLIHARRMKFPSKRLDDLATYFEIPGKMNTPKGLWRECLFGSDEAMETMVEYCEQDVRVLEDVYLHLRPWIKNHPNITFDILDDVDRCQRCGSTDLDWDINNYRTLVNEYAGYRCKCCGGIGKSRNSITSDTNKKRMVV